MRWTRLVHARLGMGGADAWRRHPIFSWNVFDAVPGIREGSALFAAYCAFDYATANKNDHHSAGGHTQAAHGHDAHEGQVKAAHH